MVLRVHRETLDIMQQFWQALMRKRVFVKKLADTVQALDLSIRQAERVYK
jgi:hypothetical protein